MPQGPRRETQRLLLDRAVDYVAAQAEAHDETPANWMVNKHVEVELDGSVTHRDLP